jgi:hypothetical protein
MVFESADPSIIKSIMQRVLYKAWHRAQRAPCPMPLIADFRAEATADEQADMMRYDVEGSGDALRFLITQEGARLAAAYGSEHLAPDQRTNRYLDDALGQERYERVIASYRACVAHKRPTYTVATVQDAGGKDVSYERLLLPFGGGDAVEQIIGSFKAISIDGGFKLNNLMGVMAATVPVTTTRAVIDREFVPTPRPSRDDAVELS